MKLVIVFFLMITSSCVFAQNEWWKKKSDSTTRNHTKNNENNETTFQTKLNKNDTVQPGEITIEKSPSVERIIRFKSSIIPPNTEPVMDGFRVQLFFDQDRKSVDNARTKALEFDSKTPTYIEYQAPNYLLLQGNYRTKLEAEKVRGAMLSEFPEAIIKEMKIYFPKIKDDEE